MEGIIYAILHGYGETYYCSPFGKSRVNPYRIDILCFVNLVFSLVDISNMTRLHDYISSDSVFAEVVILAVQNDSNRVIWIKLFQEFGPKNRCIEGVLPTIRSRKNVSPIIFGGNLNGDLLIRKPVCV